MNWKLPTCISRRACASFQHRLCDGGVSVVARGRGDHIIPANALENVRRIKTEDQNSPDSGSCSCRLHSLAVVMVMVI